MQEDNKVMKKYFGSNYCKTKVRGLMENGRYPQACCSGKHAPLQRKQTEKEVFVILPAYGYKKPLQGFILFCIYVLICLRSRFLLIKYIFEKS